MSSRLGEMVREKPKFGGQKLGNRKTYTSNHNRTLSECLDPYWLKSVSKKPQEQRNSSCLNLDEVRPAISVWCDSSLASG